MKAQIKTVKELDHQIALGLVTPGTNIPGRVKKYGRGLKTFKLPAGGRIHTILDAAIKLGGTIPRSEITKITKCDFTSRHIAHAEVLGLIKRTCSYEPQRGKKMVYKITDKGRQACEIIDRDYVGDETNVTVPVKVNVKAYLYHYRVNW